MASPGGRGNPPPADDLAVLPGSFKSGPERGVRVAVVDPRITTADDDNCHFNTSFLAALLLLPAGRFPFCPSPAVPLYLGPLPGDHRGHRRHWLLAVAGFSCQGASCDPPPSDPDQVSQPRQGSGAVSLDLVLSYVMYMTNSSGNLHKHVHEILSLLSCA